MSEYESELAALEMAWEDALDRLPDESKASSITSEHNELQPLQDYLKKNEHTFTAEERHFFDVTIAIRKLKQNKK